MTPDHAQPAVGEDVALSGRLFRPQHPGRAERHAARRLDRARPRSTSPRAAPATASPTGRSPTRRWSIRRSSPAATAARERLGDNVNLNLFADRPEDLAATPAADRRPPPPGRADDEAVRRRPFRRIRVPGRADRASSAASASSISARQREQPSAQLFHRLGQGFGRPRPARPRIEPQLERQVSPPAPACSRPTTARRCRTACSGSTRARPSSGATSCRRARG